MLFGSKADILLIHPPVVRPAEPPLGVWFLASQLRSLGLEPRVEDLNAEAFSELLAVEGLVKPATTFERRAARNLEGNLRLIRSGEVLMDFEGYRRAVLELLAILRMRGRAVDGAGRITFTDIKVEGLSPLSCRDLKQVALTGQCGPLSRFLEMRTSRALKEFRPRWVGISMQYLSQVLPTMAILGHVRRLAPDVRTVVGGSLVSIWGSRITRNPVLAPWVDVWIRGPGEGPLSELLGGRTQRSAAPITAGKSPIPWDLYLSPRRIYPVGLSRGCYWGRCKFCMEPQAGAAFEMMEVERLPTVIEEAAEIHGFEWVHLTDSAIPPMTLKAISGMDLGVRWYGFARFEPLLSKPSVARGLRRSGCRMVQLGLESGSSRVLDTICKGFHLQTASVILKNLKEAGIGVYLYVMFGVPGETHDDAMRTLDFVEAHADCVDFINTSLMNLPVGSRGFEGIERVPFPGRRFDLALYTDFRPKDGMDRREARTFMERRFRRNPMIRPLIYRNPPVFTSSHAALFMEHWIGRRGSTCG